MLHGMKPKIFMVIVFSACLLCICHVKRYEKVDPYSFIQQKYGAAESYLQPQKLIFETVDEKQENQYLVFYYNEKGTITCVLLCKGVFSYKIMDVSAEIAVPEDALSANILFSTYNKGNDWVLWGCHANEKIDVITVNGQKADTYDINDSCDLFFVHGSGLQNDLPTVYYFNTNGNMILYP